MGSMEASRNSKRKTFIGAYNGDDRISALPDEMVCHILSYLSTEEAIKSTILSKRWKLVWTSLPIITIYDYSRYGRRKYDDTITVRFSEFVDRVLTLVDVSCTREFSLSCTHSHCEFFRASKWICDIVTPGIEKLNLNFYSNKGINGGLGMVELPLKLFTSKKLMDLRLGKNIRLTVPLPVNLPNLNTLHLHCVRSLDDDSVKNLLVGCPVLEKLVIVRDDDNINNLLIMSSSLKMLELRVHSWRLKSNKNYSLIVDAINLEEINLIFILPKKFEARNFSSLVRANLDNRRKNDMDTTVDILRKIQNINHLTFSVDYSLGFANNHDLPTFRNLTSLELEINDESWPILQSIDERSPNLLSLYYIRGGTGTYYNENDRFKKIDTPKNVKFHLEKIVLEGFHGRDHEMEMIAYFMKNFPALKTISFNGVFDKKIRDKISMLPKVSEDCEIIFSEEYFGTM